MTDFGINKFNEKLKMKNEKKDKLLGKDIEALQAVSDSLGLPAFTARQMADWLYKKRVSGIDEMTNLSKSSRELLSGSYEVGRTELQRVQKSIDGTKKYLFATPEGQFIETAMIPEGDRFTVCVSSQVGCKMGCKFCYTARQGFQGQVTAGEIVNQILSIEEAEKVTNIVYMGMGEPFYNIEEVLKSLDIFTSEWGLAMSPRRITVSTIGILPGMRTFLEKSEAHLAVSLHSPFSEERRKLMPVQATYPIDQIVNEIKSWNLGRQRRISFEYIVFEGLNDTSRHVNALARLLSGLRCRINLIRYHELPDTDLKSPADDTLQRFKDQLNQKGILTTLRASRGQDIYAACGLLSTKELSKM